MRKAENVDVLTFADYLTSRAIEKLWDFKRTLIAMQLSKMYE